jgi:hypothetical protein
MITASFIINIVMGVINCFTAGIHDNNPGARLIALLVGIGLISFGITGLVRW